MDTTQQQDGPFDWSSPLGQQLGFTEDKFGGYLYKLGNQIWISAILSCDHGKGNMSKLFDTIEANGYEIIVPNPLGHMQAILEKKGFKRDKHGCHEVWSKPK